MVMSAPPQSPAAAITLLESRLGELLRRPVPESERGRLARIEIPLVGLTPLGWVRAQAGAPQYFWSNRPGHFEMGGVGEADVLVPLGTPDLGGLFHHMRQRLRPDGPSLRYYGGFRFHLGPVRGDRWGAFKAYRFIVPLFEVLRRGQEHFLACNVKLGVPELNRITLRNTLEALAALRMEEAPPHPRLPRVLRRQDLPDPHGWAAQVQEALAACAAQRFEKVVIARETTFSAETALDPLAVFARLREGSMRAYEYCFRPVDSRAFIGASPERLYRRTNCYIETEAIAGTRRRGATDTEDEALGAELLASEKEQREHRVVVHMLRESLETLCSEVKAEPAPKLLRLRHCQHLCTRLEGILREPNVDAALIATLHPTPAVGGWPRAAALQWIAEREGFDRGVYAAPVGWVGYDGAEFCVGIRSGLVKGNELTVYSGAGIVPGSVPEEEWAEIESKLGGFLAIINADL